MNNKQQGVFNMKTNFKKLIAATGLVAVATAILVGCASTTLEQQIAVKEAGSWDFAVKSASGGTNYIRIYDSPGKVGWFKYEYGQKHPCNQGFQKAIKTTAHGLVEFSNAETKSFACNLRIRYIFRTDASGHPYEGWVTELKDGDKRPQPELAKLTKFWDDKNMKPNYFLVK
jgi:hypothetical protein